MKFYLFVALITLFGCNDSSNGRQPSPKDIPVYTSESEKIDDVEAPPMMEKDTKSSSVRNDEAILDQSETSSNSKKPVENQDHEHLSVVQDDQSPPTSPSSKPTEPVVVDSKSGINPTSQVVFKEDFSSQTEKPVIKENEVKANLHQVWDELLNKYVSNNGKVNYEGLKSETDKLNNYLMALSDNFIQSDWKRNEKMAFWINAYNAFTVKLILDNYPVKSITDLHGGKPWDAKWIELGGKVYSLNQIENEILRPRFKDPRIHFAVNCAAKSCPPLLNKAWRPDTLESLFEKQTKKFINNEAFNRLSEKEIAVSKIFDWYGVDFGDLIPFLNRYAGNNIDPNAKVTYQDYDWALNK